MSREEEILDGLYANTLEGVNEVVVDLTHEGIALGMEPTVLLNEALIPAVREAGRLFECDEYFVPEMLVAGEAMAAAVEVIRPLIVNGGREPLATIIMGTVLGDIHEIGKNICNLMLEGAGFKVVDLGVNVAPEDFVEAVRENKADALGMSAFLTTTMPVFRSTIEKLTEAGLRENVKVMVGGAPVSQAYCDAVGADGFAENANACVRRTMELLGLPV